MASYASAPLTAIFSRIWPKRVLGLEGPAAPVYTSTGLLQGYQAVGNAIGDTTPAFVKFGTGLTGFTLTAGQGIPGGAGRGMTLTVATGSGTLGVASNGFDITVTLASGGSHASTVVTAINAQFAPGFCVASLNGAGSSNCAALSKTFLTTPDTLPAPT